jgi:hypothetical protein
MAGKVSKRRSRPPGDLRLRVNEVFVDMIPEAVASILTLGVIALGRTLAEWWLGSNATVFGVVPISWITDAGDVSLLVRLIWRTWRKFNG